MPDSEIKSFRVDFQPVGRRVELSPGDSILEAARAAGVGLVSLCGGEGWCESCKIQLLGGSANPPTQVELDALSESELQTGTRLACQTIPQADMLINIPAESLSAPQRLMIEGRKFDVPLAPAVRAFDLQLAPPDLEDLRADASRLTDALGEHGISNARVELPVLADLSNILRANRFSIRAALRAGEVISVLPVNRVLYGIAADLGTTKLAVYLIDLQTGTVITKTGEMNPQIAYGEDVISRIAYAVQKTNGRAKLQEILVEVLNRILAEICVQNHIEPGQIVDAVLVGNTAMHHLFAGLPVEQLVFAPYVACITDALDIRAAELQLDLAPGAYVHLLPNIAGYIGADHAAVLLSSEIWKTGQNVFAIDIGTNTEITLAAGGRLLSCSCASGPAFEGAHIKDGMRAAPGAIERVRLVDGQVKISTIADQAPVGICGSGILDATAEMRSAGVIDERGALTPAHPHVRTGPDGMREFVLVPAAMTGHGKDITITRKDINEVQLAKAAIRAGQEALLRCANLAAADIDEVIVAGAFGTYIDVQNAIKIGLFPELPSHRFKQVGNAAGMGAVQALISIDRRRLIQQIVRKVEYIELTTYRDFQNEFIRSMYL